MELTKGARLGPYEVEAPLGAGGMGEVYRARDTRLDRSVAIKILPAEFQNNAQLKLRFEREAKIVSQLNHPNICTLYDVGDGYLVMEMIEGESLADRIARGPMPLAEVLRYGTEIAEALDRAHRAGIVHRDLKPGNVMITKGVAKLLDFGLSKSSAGITFGAADATQQKPLTTEGTILGTFQYMAPEQLEGTEADARTDIFALGCVLYEMLTGRRAFEGKTRTSLIAAIVSGEPQRMTELQPLTPPAFEHVVAKCLAKSPEDRWQSAKDIAEELRWTASAGSQAGVASAIALHRRMRRTSITAAAIAGWVLAIAAAVAAVWFAQRYREANRLTHTEVVTDLAWNRIAPLTLSPDGMRIAAVVVGGGRPNQLGLRDLATGEARLLAGTEAATYPFWSPDGRSIAFFAASRLKTVNTDTGAVQIVCDAPYGRGGSWSPEGFIVFAPNIGVPLSKVSENGGTPQPVTKLAGEGTHRNPAFLPDGKHFLYCVGDIRGNIIGSTVHVGSIDGNFDRKILDYASTASYADGWLLSVRDHNLIAQRFDPEKLELKGKPVAIAQHVDWYDDRYLGVFAVARDTLVYHAAPHPKSQFLRYASHDARPVVCGAPAEYAGMELTPDGKRVASNRYDPVTDKSDLWLVDLESSTPTRLTFDADGSMEDTVAFSPDGQQVLLYTRPRGEGLMWIQPIAGGTKQILMKTIDSVSGAEWSRDGKTVMFSPQRLVTGQDLEYVRLEGARKIVPFLNSPASETNGRFSPDGRWVAYQSDESGRNEVYVTDFPAGSAKWQVSSEGALTPRWSPDGKRLYFRTKGHVAYVNVAAGASFSADTPKLIEGLDDAWDFAIASDGSVVLLQNIDPDEAAVSVVFNWQQMLKGK